jgi:hypothetical protein
MSPAKPPPLSRVKPNRRVVPQFLNVLVTSPLHAYCGLGVLVGWGMGVLVLVGLGLGLLVGLGVRVGGTGVAVGVGGSGVWVAVRITGVLVTGIGVSVGIWVGEGIGVLVGMGVWVGVEVGVKVGFGVLVGVAVGSERPIREPLPQARVPTNMAITVARITTRCLRFFITPPEHFIGRGGKTGR